MTSTTRRPGRWYPAERRLVISCRSPNASSAIGISTTAAKARSRRVRRLIAYLGLDSRLRSPIPRPIPRSRRTARAGQWPAAVSRPAGRWSPDRAIERCPSGACRSRHGSTGRLSTATTYPASVPAAAPAPALHRSARSRARRSGADGPEGARRGTRVAAGPDARARPTKRSARSRATSSLASYTIRGAGCADNWLDRSRRGDLAIRRSSATRTGRARRAPPPEQHRPRGPAARRPKAKAMSASVPA